MNRERGVDSVAVLQVEHLTKDYGHNKGVFDVSFSIEEGEVFGFLGPNGAGKTTTIRHILGFSRPQSGRTTVEGLDSWKQADAIQRTMGYLPGEIAFPDDMTGRAFIRYMAELRGLKDLAKAERLIERFELDPSGKLKRMSKGMKQKIGIVCAFMHDPRILILDEPTSGLDPLMQNAFVDLIAEEKAQGKTILMSSHIFEEVEKTCDRIAIIKAGRIEANIDADEMRHTRRKIYKLELLNDEQWPAFSAEKLEFVECKPEKRQARIAVQDEDINAFIERLSQYELKYLSEEKRTLETYFMHFYAGSQPLQKEGHRDVQ